MKSISRRVSIAFAYIDTGSFEPSTVLANGILSTENNGLLIPSIATTGSISAHGAKSLKLICVPKFSTLLLLYAVLPMWYTPSTK